MTQEETTLYRAVTRDELQEIIATGTYTLPPHAEGKYFYPTREQAQAFVARGWADVVTSATFHSELLAEAEVDTAAGEGQYLYLPQSLFPYGPVTIEETP